MANDVQQHGTEREMLDKADVFFSKSEFYYMIHGKSSYTKLDDLHNSQYSSIHWPFLEDPESKAINAWYERISQNLQPDMNVPHTINIQYGDSSGNHAILYVPAGGGQSQIVSSENAEQIAYDFNTHNGCIATQSGDGYSYVC